MSEVEETISRRLVGELADLFTMLGLGSSTATLGEIAKKATRNLQKLNQSLAAAHERIETLEYDLSEGPPFVATSDHHHESQWRALDLDDCVHISGPWVRWGVDEGRSKQDVLAQMSALQAAGYDLRLVMYQRCSYLNLTKQADREPEENWPDLE